MKKSITVTFILSILLGCKQVDTSEVSSSKVYETTSKSTTVIEETGDKNDLQSNGVLSGEL